jgi:hypothetical protein
MPWTHEVVLNGHAVTRHKSERAAKSKAAWFRKTFILREDEELVVRPIALTPTMEG